MTQQFCQTCGQANEAQARFCANCGSRLDGANVEMVATQEAPLLEIEPAIESAADTRPNPPVLGADHDLARKINDGSVSNLADLFEDRSPGMDASDKAQATPLPGGRPPTPSQTIARAIEGDKNATLNVPIVIQEQSCPLCSADLHSPEAQFCWKCGNPVTDDHEKCRNCNNAVIAGSSYCHHCGVRIEPVPS